MAARPNRLQRSEFKQRLKSVHPQLNAFFCLLSDSDEALDLSDFCAAVLNEVSRLLPFDQGFDLVSAQAESVLDLARELQVGPKLKCGEFLWLLKKWYRRHTLPLGQVHTEVTIALRRQMIKTTAEYQSQLARVTEPEERRQYEELLEMLKRQLVELQQRDLLGPAAVLSRKVAVEEEKGLQEVFKFYATQHSITGVSPTFQAITESNACVDMGSFLHFCADFGLFHIKPPQTPLRFLRKDQLQSIYKTMTPVSRKMQLPGFLSALDLVANEYFNRDYNLLYPGPCDCGLMPLAQKRILLYEMIGIGDQRRYSKACKPFQRAFSSTIEPGARIFEDDLSFRYKPRDTSRARERINRYKEEKLREKREKEALEKAKSLHQAKLALLKIKQKLEIEEGRKHGNLVKFEELPAMTSQELLGEDRQALEDLVGSND